MNSPKRRIFVGVLVMVIGFPVALIVGANVCFYALDKTNGSIVSSGITRRYLLYVPKSYDRTKPTPLVISIHPAATWPAFERNISRWNDVADEQRFIVVNPEGTGVFFDGTVPGPQVWTRGPHTLPRDVEFVSELIDKLQAGYNIDPNRVYANGMSNGGAMAFALGCELHERIAAVGVVAPAGPPMPGRDRCGGSKPIPTVAFHGTADKMVPYNGGKSPIAPKPFPNIPEWTAHVARLNQCNPEAVEARVSSGVRRLAYENCSGNANVVLYTIEGGGHTLARWRAPRGMDSWTDERRNQRQPSHMGALRPASAWTEVTRLLAHDTAPDSSSAEDGW
jgi:polyhydroxybutyrate depolymerase